MKQLVYYFFYALSLLPLRVLYLIADFEYLMLYYVIRYRRGVVRRNLTSSFPEKSLADIKQTERQFYRWFADYFFEAIKLLSISDAELRRRFHTFGSEAVEQCFRKGQNVAAILGHYGNWEWLSCVGIDLPAERMMGLVYHPLRSKSFDELFKAIRSHESNALPVPKKDILRQLLINKREGRMSIFGYISDQTPKWENIHLWLNFLHHPQTPVFTGAERIIRKMNDAVFYVEMSRPRRGYYTATYHLITREPNTMAPHAIIARFFEMLETTIRRDPRYYLWTHNRWKRTREEFDRRFEVVDGKVRPRATTTE